MDPAHGAHSVKYPVYRPSIGDLEKRYVNECLDSTWISSKGAFIQKFESAFAEFTQVRYAATVVNGPAAIPLAIMSLAFGPVDEVIVPPLPYIASSMRLPTRAQSRFSWTRSSTAGRRIRKTSNAKSHRGPRPSWPYISTGIRVIWNPCLPLPRTTAFS